MPLFFEICKVFLVLAHRNYILPKACTHTINKKMSILGTGIVKACKKRSNKTSMFFIFPAFNNENWPLKPLFFEVPSISSTTFVGRKWLFREVLEHLSSDLPTSGGMIIQGMQASGKSSIILRLVQGSSFGHQGKHRVLIPP